MSKVFFSIISEHYKKEIKFTDLDQKPPIIYEDDFLIFSINAPASYGKPIISLQDFQADQLDIKVVPINSDIVKYQTKKSKCFENFFGQSEILLSFDSNQESLAYCVEIVATKITAEQAKKLLDYLSNKMTNLLKTCFSKRYEVGSAQNSENQDITIILEHIEKGLKTFSKHKNQFKQKKITLLKPKLELQSKSQVNAITNNSILWIFNNLDKLYAVDSGSVGFINVGGRSYDIEFIENESLYENSDVYENQLILSYLYEIKDFLHKTKKTWESIEDKIEIENGYFRFEDILGEIKERLFLKPRIQRCNTLIKECNQLIAFINDYLPCKLVKGMKVKITSSVRANQHYMQLFLYIYEWQNFGEPNWQGEKYLYGLRTLWKLYEFYCLYEVIDGIYKLGFILEKSENRSFIRNKGFEGELYNDDNNPANFYSFKKERLKLQLYYEPNIWTYTKEYTKENDLIDVIHEGKGERSRYSPDFLLKLNDGKNDILLIFDSKYSKRSTVTERHLPNLVNKYLYGIHLLMGNGAIKMQAPVQFLYALHPILTNEDVNIPSYISFYNENHGLFSQHPIRPAVGAIALSPDKNSIIGDVLTKFFEIICI